LRFSFAAWENGGPVLALWFGARLSENLALINRFLQNRAFPAKREAFFAESNLHLNCASMLAESWDQGVIEKPGVELFEIAVRIWRGPAQV
jgi:hypothetical protein